MRIARVPALIAITLLAVTRPMAADPAPAGKNSLGLSAGYLGPTGDLSFDAAVGDTTVPAKIEATSTGLVALTYRYRLTDLFGLGASLLYATPDFKVSASGASGRIGNAVFMPLLVDGDFHVLKGAKAVDFYLGPTVGYAMWGDYKPTQYASTIGITESRSLKSNFVYGANFGLDVPFKVTWAFNASLRYLWAKAEPDGSDLQDIDIDPWVLTVGVAYRF